MSIVFPPWLTRSLAMLTSAFVHLLVTLILGLVVGRVLPSHGPVLELAATFDLEEELVPEFTIPGDNEPSALAADETLTVKEEPAVELVLEETEIDEIADQLAASLELNNAPQPVSVPIDEVPAEEVQFVSEENVKLPDWMKGVGTGSALEVAYSQARIEVARGLGKDLTRLQHYKREYIVVLRGAYDQIEQVLRLYRIPHTLAGNVTQADLKRCRVLCINCGAAPIHPSVLRDFVEGGGLVISTDWGIMNVQQAFPDKLRRARGTSRDDTFVVDLDRTEERLMKGVAGSDGRGSWWLEAGSFFVEIRSPTVKPLITSRDMAQRYHTSDTVACVMRAGDGELLQVVSHVFLQDGDRSGLVAMHRLLFNFLLTADK